MTRAISVTSPDPGSCGVVSAAEGFQPYDEEMRCGQPVCVKRPLTNRSRATRAKSSRCWSRLALPLALCHSKRSVRPETKNDVLREAAGPRTLRSAVCASVAGEKKALQRPRRLRPRGDGFFRPPEAHRAEKPVCAASAAFVSFRAGGSSPIRESTSAGGEMLSGWGSGMPITAAMVSATCRSRKAEERAEVEQLN